MNHEKANTDIVNADVTAAYGLTEEVLVDMMIYEAQLTHAQRKLKDQIDMALDKKDKELFLQLSSELIELEKNFGN
ncbi:IDEAL domain-containing protein [Pradoshia sp.]